MLYQAETLQLDWLEDGIAELLLNAPGSVNTLDTHTVLSLGEALSILEKQTSLRGLIVRSTKPAFIVGADIYEFLALFDAPVEQLRNWLNTANQIFNRLEDLPVPTLSALCGYALGGGCECALATDFRVGTPDVRIGLPETKLGIMPGFGGSVRLPRLIGADNAMEIIAAGQDVSAIEAMKLGLIDAIVDSETLTQTALNTLKLAISGQLAWQARRQIKLRPLQLNKVEAKMSFTTAQAVVSQMAGKHYPAPSTAIKSISESASMTREAAQTIETEHFLTLASSPEARALVGLFLSEQQVKSQAKKRAKNISPPKQAAVLGAGIMGGGIAYQSALRNVPILMKDIRQEALDLGMQEAIKLLNQQVTRGKMDNMGMASALTRIQPTLSDEALSQAEVVVEAVVENSKIKAAVLSEVEKTLPSESLLASNTSTIPIDQLANALQRPEQFCGMHFFNPVHRMPLVEIIQGTKTSQATLARITAYALKMGKTPIVVKDCPGFFVNRVLFPYFAAFSLMLAEGVDFRYVDKIMEQQFGWPMGPAYLLDVVGIDTASHASQVMAAGYPDRMAKSNPDALDTLYAAQRLGQKNQQGFYRYSLDKKGKLQKTFDDSVLSLLYPNSPPSTQLSPQEVIERMMIPMVNEVVRCLEEGIIDSCAEADIALIYGIGFPPFRGGAIRYLDTLGCQKYVAMTQKYPHLGALYPAPRSLLDKADKNLSFYPAPTPLTLPQ